MVGIQKRIFGQLLKMDCPFGPRRKVNAFNDYFVPQWVHDDLTSPQPDVYEKTDHKLDSIVIDEQEV